MQTGSVWVNRYYNFKPGQSIGGCKQSGIGIEATFDTLVLGSNPSRPAIFLIIKAISYKT
jgi:hypothetical protein